MKPVSCPPSIPTSLPIKYHPALAPSPYTSHSCRLLRAHRPLLSKRATAGVCGRQSGRPSAKAQTPHSERSRAEPLFCLCRVGVWRLQADFPPPPMHFLSLDHAHKPFKTSPPPYHSFGARVLLASPRAHAPPHTTNPRVVWALLANCGFVTWRGLRTSVPVQLRPLSSPRCLLTWGFFAVLLVRAG